MSQPAAVSSASLARSSPRCQAWTSLPRLPSGCSRLWSGPATKPSSEIDMWQVVFGIGIPSGVGDWQGGAPSEEGGEPVEQEAGAVLALRRVLEVVEER